MTETPAPALRGRRVEVDPIEVYQAMLLEIWADGVVTQKEKRALVALRERLQVSAEEHEHLEAQVTDHLFPDGIPRRGV